MTKTLILMRHGDADYEVNGLTDKGRSDVDAVAQKLAAQGLVPDIILSSPAGRARETALRVRDVFAKHAQRDIKLRLDPKLNVSATRLPQPFSLAPKSDVVLVVTHQPNVEHLSGRFGKRVSPQTSQASVFKTQDAWDALQTATFEMAVTAHDSAAPKAKGFQLFGKKF